MNITIQLESSEGLDRVVYIGPINEEAEFHLGQLLEKLGPVCEINLSKVEYVNSCGVRAWINFMREAEKDRKIALTQCTPEIVMQMNMVPSFRGRAEIRSVYASYECNSCGHADKFLFEAGKNLPQTDEFELDPVNCPKCQSEMEMEEMEDEYFAFAAA